MSARASLIGDSAPHCAVVGPRTSALLLPSIVHHLCEVRAPDVVGVTLPRRAGLGVTVPRARRPRRVEHALGWHLGHPLWRGHTAHAAVHVDHTGDDAPSPRAPASAHRVGLPDEWDEAWESRTDGGGCARGGGGGGGGGGHNPRQERVRHTTHAFRRSNQTNTKRALGPALLAATHPAT